MAETTKVMYIVVVDDDDDFDTTTAIVEEDGTGNWKDSFRYTRPVLQSTLQLMGCKARHAFKISRRVFELIRSEGTLILSPTHGTESVFDKTCDAASACAGVEKVSFSSTTDDVDKSKSKPFEMHKRRTTVVVPREIFVNVVCHALAEYKYVGHDQRADLILACKIRERKESVTVLLCGTSGCGKSTLSALLGSRLGITTVVSTDSIRHMMRSFVDEKQDPLLWASTYHAGECLDPVAVAESKAKRRRAKKNYGKSTVEDDKPTTTTTVAALLSHKQMAVEGFKAQSEMVIENLDRLITAWEERKESVVVEGVHLSLNFVLIQRQGSSRHLMALLNTDGTFSRTWPLGGKVDETMEGNGMVHPVYGYLQKAEPVNLQFGLFGISAWPSDGATSRAGSVDYDSRADLGENGKAEDDAPDEQDTDFSDDDDNKQDHEEVGSVDEQSTKSDEEYDDLAMEDKSYWTDNEEESRDTVEVMSEEKHKPATKDEKYVQNLDLFLRTAANKQLVEPLELCASLFTCESGNTRRLSGKEKMKKRSLSISALGKHGSGLGDPIVLGAP
ncbi:hypothetical protein IGI04_005228 [Brassica rapa subsp. trilocularis]|uniref:P-loop containing nucleoside triphosphate hydrolase n=1 Tax=Brassica rapa subsp. trilocularis TaxID=1813537 RepID=A0ABQ7NDE4_BRACM|nr:hypothetical protein IGI04_005228 [Brassica rapa subsp. trilocularis]